MCCFNPQSFTSNKVYSLSALERRDEKAILEDIWKLRQLDTKAAVIAFADFLSPEIPSMIDINQQENSPEMTENNKCVLEFDAFGRSDKNRSNKKINGNLFIELTDSNKLNNNRLPFTVINGKDDMYILVNTDNKFIPQQNLGKGASGKVRVTYSVKRKEFIAVKKEVYEYGCEMSLERESRIMKQLNVDDCEFVSSKKKNGALVGYLFSELREGDLEPVRYSLSNNLLLKVLMNVSDNLRLFHKKDILHLDIKLQNIFMKLNYSKDHNIVAGLGDFGLSVIQSENKTDNNQLAQINNVDTSSFPVVEHYPVGGALIPAGEANQSGVGIEAESGSSSNSYDLNSEFDEDSVSENNRFHDYKNDEDFGIVGSIKYLSPEIIFDFEYVKGADIWSLGTVLLRLIFDDSLLFKKYDSGKSDCVYKKCIQKEMSKICELSKSDTIIQIQDKHQINNKAESQILVYESFISAKRPAMLNNFIGLSDDEISKMIDGYCVAQENLLENNQSSIYFWRENPKRYLTQTPELMTLLKDCFKNNPEDRCSANRFNAVIRYALKESNEKSISINKPKGFLSSVATLSTRYSGYSTSLITPATSVKVPDKSKKQ
jgi:serine/threonine protein kinase